MTHTQCHLYSACHHSDSSLPHGGEGLGWVACRKLRLRPGFTAWCWARQRPVPPVVHWSLGHSSTPLDYLATFVSFSSHDPFPQTLRRAPRFLKPHLTFKLASPPQLLGTDLSKVSLVKGRAYHTTLAAQLQGLVVLMLSTCLPDAS